MPPAPPATDVVDAGDPRLAEFHGGIYRDAFPKQLEPLAAWQRALRGDAAYAIAIRIAVDDAGAIAGGIVYERYPRSGCGLVTYMVVAPAARRGGLGARLLREAAEALHVAGAPVVFGEVDDPRVHATDVARDRLARFVRWGARIADVEYVQPSLGAGRDTGLCLIVLPGARALPASLDGALVREFLDEFYAATEGGPSTLRVPDRVALRDTSSR